MAFFTSLIVLDSLTSTVSRFFSDLEWRISIFFIISETNLYLLVGWPLNFNYFLIKICLILSYY